MKRIPLVMFVVWCSLSVFPQTANELLIKALYNHDSSTVVGLLKQGADLTQSDVMGTLPLMHAVYSGSKQMVALLLKKGADVNASNDYGFTALVSAIGMPDTPSVAKKNKKDIVLYLLEKGADVNHATAYGATPLIQAIQFRKADMALLLIEHGANVNVKDVSGSCLYHAITADAYDVAELLLKKGADVNATTSYNSPLLHYAITSDKQEAARLLLENGADVNLRDYNNQTPLMVAVSYNKKLFCKLLYDFKADLTLKDSYGKTALDISKDYNYTDIASFLENPAANSSKLEKIAPDEELMSAIKKSDVQGVRNALNKGADANYVDDIGYTAVMWASQISNMEIIRLLLDKGADVNKTTNEYYNTLHIAAGTGNAEITKLLLEKGADVNKKLDNGWTPMMEAAYRGHIEVCKQLYAHKADLSVKNNDEQTALDVAIQNDNVLVAAYLKAPKEFKDDIVWQIQHVYLQQNMSSNNRYVEVIDSTKKALLEVIKSGNKHKYLEALNSLGIVYQSTGEYKPAEEKFKEALELTKTKYGEQHSEYVKALNRLGGLYQLTGNYQSAETIIRQAMAVSKSLSGESSPDYGESLSNLASLYMNTGNYDEAESFYKKSLAAYEGSVGKNNTAYANLLDKLADYYLLVGGYDEAQKLYMEAWTLRGGVIGINHPDYITSWHKQGVLWNAMGYNMMAEVYIFKSLGMRQKVLGINHPDYAQSLIALAELYVSKSNYAAAELLYKQGIIIYGNTIGKKHPDYAKALNNFSKLYQSIGNYVAAEKLLREALAIYKEIYSEKHPAYAESLNNLGILFKETGRYDEAEPMLKESLTIIKEITGKDSQSYTEALNNLAMLYFMKEDYAAAEPLLQEAIAVCKESSKKGRIGIVNAEYTNNLAMVYHATGSSMSAEPLYMTAIALRKGLLGENHIDNAIAMNNLARLYISENRFKQAEPYVQDALKIYLYQIDNTFPVLSEKEKELFYNTIKYDFNFFNYFCLKYYKEKPSLIASIYDNQLSTKAMILNSTINVRNRILLSEDEELIKKYKEWTGLREYLANLYNSGSKKTINIDSLENKTNELEKYISLKSLDFADAYTCKKPTWQTVRDKLKKNEAAIEMVRVEYNDTVYYVALIVKNTTTEYPEFVILPDNGLNLEGKYLKFYNNAIQYKIEDKNSYKNYWLPIKKNLDGISKVYFSADGVYNQINLNTLLNTETNTYLIDELDIHLVTNTKDILTYGRKGILSKKSVLLGRPTYKMDADEYQEMIKDKTRGTSIALEPTQKLSDWVKATSFADLPGTEKEINGISEVLKKNNWQNEIYLAENALEENVKMIDNPTVLHFATHGFFIPQAEQKKQKTNRMFGGCFVKSSSIDPMLRSGIVMAGVSSDFQTVDNNTEDGILTAYEAMSLNLNNTDLVVLSACETGLGEIKSGEGVYGLQRALKVAGTKDILMSLWKVNDDATQELMNTFYTEWLASNNKRLAFQKAQKQLREKYKEPYYWGAFVMVGE